MFEQATLMNAPAGTRAWSAFLGLTTQIAVVSVAVLIPMAFPQVLPTARILETLVPPLPPAPPRPLGEMRRTATSNAMRRVPWTPVQFTEPKDIPRGVPRIVDEPAETGVVGSPEGSSTGSFTGVIQGILDGVERNVRVPPLRTTVAPVIKPPDPAQTIVRYKEGGRVVLGAPIHRVEPPYPQIAKAAHISGIVELECVVGADGRIKEVKVLSGNPLLVHAAVDAAWQWIYGPSKLNGDPIEIITKLTFAFKLN